MLYFRELGFLILVGTVILHGRDNLDTVMELNRLGFWSPVGERLLDIVRCETLDNTVDFSAESFLPTCSLHKDVGEAVRMVAEDVVVD